MEMRYRKSEHRRLRKEKFNKRHIFFLLGHLNYEKKMLPKIIGISKSLAEVTECVLRIMKKEKIVL
jgi:hypothetical protein